MRVLVIEKDKVIRDQILVGLQSFPEFAVETGVGFGGLSQTKQKDYDCVFIGCDLADGNLDLLETFRQMNPTTDAVLVTSSKRAKGHQQLRTRYSLFSILYTPIEPREFFRLVARLRRREAPV